MNWGIANKQILTAINGRLKKNTFTAILGANGAGKSTLVKLISKELNAHSGEIKWRGAPLEKYKAADLARERAVLTQKSSMNYDFPVQEVVMMGRYPHFKNHPQKGDYTAVEESLQAVQMLEFKTRNFLSLSGGEQQRVHLARVLAQLWDENKIAYSEKLLLLDEPLNNLDIKHQHEILQLSRDFAHRENVVLAVLHDVNLAAMYADEIILLKNGKIFAHGTPAEVLGEEQLSICYDMPVCVQQHPFCKCPVAYFGNTILESKNNHKQHKNYSTEKQSTFIN
ncbi:MAG: heme ABC transporter ATP-binding protein [Candidatus Babeliales bacterium]